jgi:long-chain acyl-CoA synthetase
VSDIGLWTIAAQTPDRAAVIEPDGTVVSYAALAARADQLGRGLQALGLAPGATVAGMLPNGAEALALFFAALETGLYVVPVNWHLTAAEVAYILGDSEASAFVAHERFTDVAAAAADLAGIAPGARFAVGAVPGFTPLADLGAGGSGRPQQRTTGAPMLYTSGTSGRPKGVRRALTGEDPDAVPPYTQWFFGIFGLKPFDDHVHLCCSPLYHTAVLNFATISIQLGHPVVLMDRFDPETLLALVERRRVTSSRAARAGPRPVRRQLAALHDSRRRAVPAGGQAADARLVGAGRDRVLRGDRRRRQRHHRAAVARPARIGRHRLARFRGPGARR